jgi:predicted transport protein
MDIILNGNKLSQYKYTSEEEFEKDIVITSKSLFGKKSVYIDFKRKISGNALGASIPDGFLIDFSDEDSPEFYIVEVELAKHDFYQHIFPQITKFFAFFASPQSRNDLIDKIYNIIDNDAHIKNEIKNFSKGKEIYKILKDCVDSNQNILLIIDEVKPELLEIFNVYKNWEDMVKVEIIKKFVNDSNAVFSMEPEFEEIDFYIDGAIDKSSAGSSNDYSESDHLAKAKAEVKEIYSTLKSKLLSIDSSLVFNPQRYYISIRNTKNITFIKIRQKKIRIIIMLEPDVIFENIKKNGIKELSQSVQNFYHGPCAAVDVTDKDNIDEVIELLKKLLQN